MPNTDGRVGCPGCTRAPTRAQHLRSGVYGGCVLPQSYLLRVGFKTHRAHQRYPRMRLELKSVVTWRDEVEGALEKLLGAVRPARHPAVDPTHRLLRPAAGGSPHAAR